MDLLAQATSSGGANVAEIVLFWVFAVIGLGAGIAMVTMRNIVHAALMLVVNFLAIAALYLGLQSSFLSIIQVIVYAGAIMVLFLFVIMLLGVDRDDLLVEIGGWQRVGAVLGAAGLAALLLFVVAGTYTTPASRCGDQAPTEVTRLHDQQPCVGMDAALASSDSGSVGVVADRLFTRYTFPFEAAAVLLTVATIGAMVLGRRTEVPQDEDPGFEPSVALPEEEDDVEEALEPVSITREEIVGEDAMHPGDPDAEVYDRVRPDDSIGSEYGRAPTSDVDDLPPWAEDDDADDDDDEEDA